MFEDKNLKPMLLKEVSKPFNDSKYIYELKFDGIRAIIYASKDEFVIKSRNGVDITQSYPELKSIQKIVRKKEVIFDGEIVILENKKPSFKKLQERSNLKNKDKIKDVALEMPVIFVAFDILFENKELINLPLDKRLKYLSKYEDTNYFIKSKNLFFL